MPDTRVPTAPCSKCGRPVAETAKRCLYCGAPQYKAAPGTPERAAEEAAALEEDKKLKRQAALYRAGVGMAKGEASPDQGAGLLKALLMLFVNPISSFKILRKIFRP
ncbi:MAG TPA: zinc ribbon domain-containing protein [Gemmatimonadales bacterium]|nr:zinc ribbon domain-containing protein [Gemmatimonadales bacterium]